MSLQSYTLDALMGERSRHCEAVEAIDEEFRRRGLVPSAPRPKEPTILHKRVVALLEKPRTVGEVAAVTGQTTHAAEQYLSDLCLKGIARRIGRGLFGVAK